MKRSTWAAIVVILLLIIGGAWWSQQNDQVNEPTSSSSTRLTDSAETSDSTDQRGSTEVSYEGVAGRTALDLLKESYTVETTKYDFGEFVTSINGVAAEEGQNFWEFQVDGEQATVGADQYVTKDGEQIGWRLTEINAAGQ